MREFIVVFSNMVRDIINLLIDTTIDGVSLGGVLFAGIVIVMIAGIFWKGAKG